MSEEQVEEPWQPCPQGEIARMVQWSRRRRQTTAVTQALSGTLCLLVLGFAIVHVFGPFRSTQMPGEITCAEVRDHAKDYLSGHLDTRLRARIEVHLRHCPHCRDELRRMSEAHSSYQPDGDPPVPVTSDQTPDLRRTVKVASL